MDIKQSDNKTRSGNEIKQLNSMTNTRATIANSIAVMSRAAMDTETKMTTTINTTISGRAMASSTRPIGREIGIDIHIKTE